MKSFNEVQEAMLCGKRKFGKRMHGMNVVWHTAGEECETCAEEEDVLFDQSAI